jgi:hypothetical protein
MNTRGIKVNRNAQFPCIGQNPLLRWRLAILFADQYQTQSGLSQQSVLIRLRPVQRAGDAYTRAIGMEASRRGGMLQAELVDISPTAQRPSEEEEDVGRGGRQRNGARQGKVDCTPGEFAGV